MRCAAAMAKTMTQSQQSPDVCGTKTLSRAVVRHAQTLRLQLADLKKKLPRLKLCAHYFQTLIAATGLPAAHALCPPYPATSFAKAVASLGMVWPSHLHVKASGQFCLRGSRRDPGSFPINKAYHRIGTGNTSGEI